MATTACGFVRVCPTDPKRFEADGAPFYFAGANCYYLLTRGAAPDLRHECTAVLDDAAAAGLTVLRTWAFCDGPTQWNALQPSPGVYDERVFRSLDWLLAGAACRGLRLLLVLTNYWEDYGGMRQYVAWSREHRGEPPAQPGQLEAEPFYTDPDCQRMFRSFVHTLVHRVNSLTGVQYRDDPTILGWALANEPRCSGDASCQTIRRWAGDTAAYLKSLDPNHLVTLDVEGFLGPSTPDQAAHHNPHSCAGTGCDFAADCGGPHIDFACCHLYPDLWRPSGDTQDHLSWALGWLDCHASLCTDRLRKPLVLSEFGKRRRAAGTGPDGGHRAEWYAQVLARVLHHMRGGSGVAGSIFWMLAAPSYPDYDGFTVYFDRTSAAGTGCAAGASTGGTAGAGMAGGGRTVLAERRQSGGLAAYGSRSAAVIRQHAVEVAALNRRPQGLGGWTANPLLPTGGAVGSAAGGSSSASVAGPCHCCPHM